MRKHAATVSALRARALCKATCLMVMVALTSACSYKLRGQDETLAFSFPEIAIECDRKSEFYLCQYLFARVTAAGTEINDKASVSLSIARRESQQRAFTIREDATAAEYELTHTIEYSLRDKEQDLKLAGRQISRQQIYRRNASALIAKDREQAFLERQLDEALVNIMLREISLLKR